MAALYTDARPHVNEEAYPQASGRAGVPRCGAASAQGARAGRSLSAASVRRTGWPRRYPRWSSGRLLPNVSYPLVSVGRVLPSSPVGPAALGGPVDRRGHSEQFGEETGVADEQAPHTAGGGGRRRGPVGALGSGGGPTHSRSSPSPRLAPPAAHRRHLERSRLRQWGGVRGSAPSRGGGAPEHRAGFAGACRQDPIRNQFQKQRPV